MYKRLILKAVVVILLDSQRLGGTLAHVLQQIKALGAEVGVSLDAGLVLLHLVRAVLQNLDKRWDLGLDAFSKLALLVVTLAGITGTETLVVLEELGRAVSGDLSVSGGSVDGMIQSIIICSRPHNLKSASTYVLNQVLI